MRRKRAVMRDSTFVFWETKAADVPIGWPEAQRRIAEDDEAKAGSGQE
ncbi:hypothetical protein [Actinomadura sp. WMMA1423]|nr:hypothetical protein [Actinomadura sp. WMMA1423]